MSRPAASGGDHGRRAPAGREARRRPSPDRNATASTGPATACSMRGAPLESVRADRGAVSCFEADNAGEALDPVQLTLIGKQDLALSVG